MAAQFKHDPIVYFMRSPTTGLIKIGVTTNIEIRSAAIARDRNGVGNVEIIGYVVGGQPRERELHRRFAGARRKREWFEPTAELLAYIEREACPYDRAVCRPEAKPARKPEARTRPNGDPPLVLSATRETETLYSLKEAAKLLNKAGNRSLLNKLITYYKIKHWVTGGMIVLDAEGFAALRHAVELWDSRPKLSAIAI